ncbi:thymidine phosphorylase [bacterium]|nr:thymidine phosphorylase [bacterium]
MKTAVEMIEAKKRGQTASREELRAFFGGYMEGKVADYQMSAYLMAVCLNGLEPSETLALTECIIESGTSRPRENFGRPVIDKHSTGGVGDKPTIVLLPLLACMGALVPTLAGRGLGHTGGTVDKLEAIPGLRQMFSWEEGQRLLKENGAAFMTQSDEVARLDKRLYALRDVTGTVDSIGLITSSILGKKLSESLDGLVLDVKYGSGAFMRTFEEAEKLARSLHKVSTSFGVRTEVLLTDMNEPLGEWAGNGVEVMEAMRMLRGEKTEERFYNVTMSLAESMCRLAFPNDRKDFRKELEQKLKSGEAYERFLKMISGQGASAETVSKLDEILAPPEHCLVVKAPESGYLREIDTFALGKLLITLGAGRKVLTDKIDHKPGLRFKLRRGEYVDKGEAIMEVYSSRALDISEIPEIFSIGLEPPETGEYIHHLNKQAEK